MAAIDEAKWAAAIVQDAGGKIVGRTRLQKLGFLLEAAGLGAGFRYSYRHFGPYSEELAEASGTAVQMKLLQEVEQRTLWGGYYSVFSTTLPQRTEVPAARRKIAEAAAAADAVELELAATALFLATEGISDPWAETAKRKPDKAAEQRLTQAKELYSRIFAVAPKDSLPQL